MLSDTSAESAPNWKHAIGDDSHDYACHGLDGTELATRRALNLGTVCIYTQCLADLYMQHNGLIATPLHNDGVMAGEVKWQVISSNQKSKESQMVVAITGVSTFMCWRAQLAVRPSCGGRGLHKGTRGSEVNKQDIHQRSYPRPEVKASSHMGPSRYRKATMSTTPGGSRGTSQGAGAASPGHGEAWTLPNLI